MLFRLAQGTARLFKHRIRVNHATRLDTQRVPSVNHSVQCYGHKSISTRAAPGDDLKDKDAAQAPLEPATLEKQKGWGAGRVPSPPWLRSKALDRELTRATIPHRRALPTGSREALEYLTASPEEQAETSHEFLDAFGIGEKVATQRRPGDPPLPEGVIDEEVSRLEIRLLMLLSPFEADAMQGDSQRTPRVTGPHPHADTLGTFNAAMVRYGKSGLVPSLSLPMAGLIKAVELRVPVTVQFYLELLNKWAVNRLPAENYKVVIQKVHAWAVKVDNNTKGRGRQDQAALLSLLTGYAEDVDAPGMEGWACLHDVVSPFAPEVIESYLSTVRLLGGAPAILKMWKMIDQDLHQQSSERSQTAEHTQLVLRTFVDNLVLAGAPDKAWEVADSYLDKPHAIADDTWSRLLAYPEYVEHLRKLHPHMAPHIYTALERWLEQLERDLGLEWDRSHRKHVATDEDLQDVLDGKHAWMMEDEGFTSEDIARIQESPTKVLRDG